jgi:hypothetical protein
VYECCQLACLLALLLLQVLCTDRLKGHLPADVGLVWCQGPPCCPQACAWCWWAPEPGLEELMASAGQQQQGVAALHC